MTSRALGPSVEQRLMMLLKRMTAGAEEAIAIQRPQNDRGFLMPQDAPHGLHRISLVTGTSDVALPWMFSAGYGEGNASNN